MKERERKMFLGSRIFYKEINRDKKKDREKDI